MTSFFRRIIAFFFPTKCIFCRTLLPTGTSMERAVCPRCERSLPYTMARQRCKGCGRPVGGGYVYCRLCRDHNKRPFRSISTAYLYQGSVKNSVVRFKSESYRGYAGVYARHLRAVVAYDCPDAVFDGLVTVPPRKDRMFREGYDQAEELGKRLAAEMQIPYLPQTLAQKKRQPKQSRGTQQERWNNMMGNILVRHPETVEGKTLLLVDDVCTTGASFFASAQALKDAGAKRVYCAAVATSAK